MVARISYKAWLVPLPGAAVSYFPFLTESKSGCSCQAPSGGTLPTASLSQVMEFLVLGIIDGFDVQIGL